MYFLYTFLTLVFFALLSPYFVYQAIRHKKYVGTLRQRFGYLPVSFNTYGEESIWIHAVSVGEALTARALAPELRRAYPRHRLYMSTTTLAGQQVARQNIRHFDDVFYFPFDVGPIVRRTLRLVKPRLFIMMETEIWPHLLRRCRETGVKTMLVNGRISARSYPRYRVVRPFFRRVLDNVDWFCVQNEESARRLIELGADRSRVTVTGSLKFDSLRHPGAAAAPFDERSGRGEPGRTTPGIPPKSVVHGDDRVLRFFRISANRPVVVAGSTMRGEEEAVIEAFRHVRGSATRALLVIAPRHPERFAEVEALAAEAGFRTLRRSELRIDEEPRADVVVLDTIGELASLYQIATVVFVGGSLVDTGGHNILEPAIFGKPIVFGPHMQNFAEIAHGFLAARAAVQVRGRGELEQTLRQLLTDGDERARLGAAARTIVEANRGAREKTVAAITTLLPPAELAGRTLRLVRS